MRWVAMLGALAGCAEDPADRAPTPLPSADSPAAVSDLEPRALDLPDLPSPDLRPLPRLRHRCADRRFPRLAGAWLLGCDALGRVAWAEALPDGPQVEIAEPAEQVGAAPGALYAHVPAARAWSLPDPLPRKAGSWGPSTPVASPAFDGARVALALPGRVAAFGVGDQIQRSWEAAPRPWFPPALSWPTVLWVDDRDQASRGTDIWRWDQDGGPPRPHVAAPGDQRHVVAGDGWAAWTDERGVWLERLADGVRWRWSADSGFRAPPTLWYGAVCWEDRAGGDSDVACSDGLRVGGPGDQGWPSRWGPWLLYREDGAAWLATARELTITRDDPRAEPAAGPAAGFSVRLAWPASGWCAEVAAGGAWTAAGAVPVAGAVALDVPGDAIRLRPAVTGQPCPGEAA